MPLRCEGGTALRCEGGTPSRQPPGRGALQNPGSLFSSSGVRVGRRSGVRAGRRSGVRAGRPHDSRRDGGATNFRVPCSRLLWWYPRKLNWRTGYAPPARRRTADRDSYLHLNHGVTTNPGRRHGSAADFGLGCPQVHPTICNVEMSQNISGQSCRLAPICMGLGLDRRS